VGAVPPLSGIRLVLIDSTQLVTRRIVDRPLRKDGIKESVLAGSTTMKGVTWCP
jgi:hypothetical protein